MNGMANANIIYRTFEGVPFPEVFEQLTTAYTSIFEDADISFFKKRFLEKEQLLSVIAFDDNEIIGFKIGYRYSTTTFYSWVGGVLPNYRQQGVAKQLAKFQEDLVVSKGYKSLRTKSMNRFKPMMILNLKNGFNITQVYTNAKGQTKVVFEKTIG